MSCAPQWIDFRALLSSVPLFKDMAPDGIARLANAARELRVTRGDFLFRKDDLCTGLYQVVYGRVKLVFSSPQGCEKILDIMAQGNSFCEATMFLGKNHPVYAQVLSDCLLLHVPKAAVLAELERDTALARGVIDCLSQQVLERTADIESYSLHSGRQRVVHHLLREIGGVKKHSLRDAKKRTYRRDRNGRSIDKGGHQLVLQLTTSKGAIASRLNLTQEHFSRILHELSEDGFIAVDGRDIYVRDVEQLRTAAD